MNTLHSYRESLMGNTCRDCLFWYEATGECCEVGYGTIYHSPDEDYFMICTTLTRINHEDILLKTGPYFSCNRFKNKEVNG